MTEHEDCDKENVGLTITIDTGNDKPVSAEVAAEVIKNVVDLLKAIEENMTGKPAEVAWVITEMETIVDGISLPGKE